MHFCSLVAKSWECKSDNNKSIGQRLAKILVYCEKPWRTSIGLKQLVKVSHRGLVGGRLELGEALYVDRLVVPCTVKQSACPHFLSLSKSFDQYWSFSIIIKRFFIHTDLRWHHLWTTRSLGLIQSHGRCEEPHTELMMTFMIFFLLWNFHHDFYDNFPSSWSSSTCISWRGKNMFYLGNVFVPRRRVLICWLPGLESHLAGFYPSDHSPHEDDHDDPMIIISSNLFCFAPLIILRMTMIMRTMFLRW